MNNYSLVSVIIPIYKVEKYLKRCVESILSQTYSNLEIILVDDGSPDQCGKICDQYVQKDSRIRVIHKTNGGLSDARNAGMAIASGEIIAFVDSDDWIEPDMIADMVSIMDNHQSDIVACGFNVTDGHDLTNNYVTDRITDYTSMEAMELLCESRVIESHAWDKIYRREVLEGMEFPKGKLFEDVFVMHEIFKKADKVTFVDHPYYNYYQRSGSILSDRTLQSFLNLKEGMEKRLADLDSYPESTKDWVRFRLIRGIVDIFRILSSLDKKDSKILDDCMNTIKKVDPNAVLGRRLDGNMRIDYFLMRHLMLTYGPYRKTVTVIKTRNLKHQMGDVKRYMRHHAKVAKSYLSSFSDEKLLVKDGRARFILMGSPEYDNLGDHAIAYATKVFVESHFPDALFCEVTEIELESHLNKLKSCIGNEDVLLLQGGGNLGNVYMDQQNFRRKVLESFPNNRVILMPQTCDFTADEAGKAEYVCTRKLFEKHGNITLFAREIYSFEYMKKAFPRTPVFLVPDIVLCLNASDSEARRGIGLCIRDDKEGLLELAEKNYLNRVCSKYGEDIEYFNTCNNNRHYTMKERTTVLQDFLKQIAEYRMVITDRLHGVIFCAITGTPCIAISNSNHKIKGICNWLQDIPTIYYCEDVYTVESMVGNLIEERCGIVPHLEEEYRSLISALRGEKS